MILFYDISWATLLCSIFWYNWHGEGRSGQGFESGTMQLNPAPCVWDRVPAESRGTALTPCAAFPMLLPHGEQFLHAIIHGLGELPHSVTLLFSGDRDSCQHISDVRHKHNTQTAWVHGFDPKYCHKTTSALLGIPGMWVATATLPHQTLLKITTLSQKWNREAVLSLLW